MHSIQGTREHLCALHSLGYEEQIPSYMKQEILSTITDLFLRVQQTFFSTYRLIVEGRLSDACRYGLDAVWEVAHLIATLVFELLIAPIAYFSLHTSVALFATAAPSPREMINACQTRAEVLDYLKSLKDGDVVVTQHPLGPKGVIEKFYPLDENEEAILTCRKGDAERGLTAQLGGVEYNEARRRENDDFITALKSLNCIGQSHERALEVCALTTQNIYLEVLRGHQYQFGSHKRLFTLPSRKEHSQRITITEEGRGLRLIGAHVVDLKATGDDLFREGEILATMKVEFSLLYLPMDRKLGQLENRFTILTVQDR